MASEAPPIGADDQALLDRVAARVVELHMEIPAILTLETAKPLTVIASQSLIFFEPMLQALFRLSDYRRFAALVERREVVEALITRIETRAETARARRAAERSTPGGRQD